MSALTDSVTLRPEPARWADSARSRFALLDDRGRAARAELGLPTDRPVVMSGHQPGFWHPGIVAKWFAATACAERAGGVAAWVVVDQDEADVGAVALPLRNGEGLRRWVWRWAPAPEGRAACALASARPPEVAPPEGGQPAVEGAPEMARALERRRDEPNAARQAARAAADLLGAADAPVRLVFATDLARLDLFGELLDALLADPERAALTYNRAVRRRPDAGVAPLLLDDVQHRFELPLWWIGPDGRRRRVYAEDFAGEPPGSLAPRGLLMTALLRLAACDFFIHGVGGGRYDQITEEWVRDWLGAGLAPMGVATADLRLPLEAPAESEADVAGAAWRAHHARHEPAALGRPDLSEEKHRMVAEIAALPARSRDRTAVYLRMHEMLERVRLEERDRLAELDAGVERARRAAEARRLASDRAWPFPLHPARSIAALRDRVRGAIGGTVSGVSR